MKKIAIFLLAAAMVLTIAVGAAAAGDDYVYVPDPNNEWTGGVGFSQWSTAVSYSSIKVTNNVDGHVLLDEEFDDPDLSGWNYFGRSNGDWDASNTDDWFVEDGSLIFDDYTKHGATIWTGDPNWGNYTVTVKGTVLGGEEGLCVFFCTKGPSDHYFFNIGGWSNTRAYAKWEVNGDIGNTDHVDCTLTYGQEYTVTIVVGPKGVSGYLEGEKLFELGEGGEANAETPAAATDEPAAPTFTYPASGESGSFLSGTVIGNATGWDGTEGSGSGAAFDGNPATFFDPPAKGGDNWCGMDFGKKVVLEKVAILSRENWNARFDGAQIDGSNDGTTWTTLWRSDTTGTNPDYYVITEFENNTGYSMYRYYNEKEHGDVAEVEFYGTDYVEPAPVGEEPETPAVSSVDEELEAKAEAPNTFDFGVIAAVAAVISLAGFAAAKKKH